MEETTFIPTIVVLDSWNATCPKELRDISKNNNMYDAQKIKENNKMISMIYPLCKQANIMMFIVCQMSDKIQTGFDFKPSDYQALQQDVKINKKRMRYCHKCINTPKQHRKYRQT
jgi:RecA/RadA recombinase